MRSWENFTEQKELLGFRMWFLKGQVVISYIAVGDRKPFHMLICSPISRAFILLRLLRLYVNTQPLKEKIPKVQLSITLSITKGDYSLFVLVPISSLATKTVNSFTFF